MLDTEFVRPWFPALDTRWALFDNAGGSVPVRSVIERIAEYMCRRPVQTGATYALSVDAAEAIANGRRAVARLLGADEDEVVLGGSATELARRLAEALVPTWRDGDEVVVTDLDHETNVGPWRALEADGIRVREWRFRRDTCRLELDDLRPLLNDRTRLVAFTHCANVVGTIHDVPAITRAIRDAGALSCVDGVAYAPHRRVDVRALGCDFYLASLYKVLGPHVGAMFGRRDALLAARGVNHFFVPEDDPTYKFEPGGVAHELVAALVGIGEYLDAVRVRHGGTEPFELFAEAEERLAAPVLEMLAASPRVTVLGEASADRERRVGTIAFTVDGRHASEIPRHLERDRVACRFGHFYAYRAIEALGLVERGGVTRVSLLHYNSPDEIERLVRALEPLVS